MNDKKTLKLELKLNSEDIELFEKKCTLDGTTPAEVLEGFIADLVLGVSSHGSDEEMLASQYYDRCGYGRWN